MRFPRPERFSFLNSANVFDGSFNVGSSAGDSLRLNDQPLYLRAGTDENHGLAYNGSGIVNFPNASVQPDGPVLWGFTGGALATLTSEPPWCPSPGTHPASASTGVLNVTGVITGNGSGLTNLNPAQLTGTVPLAQLPVTNFWQTGGNSGTTAGVKLCRHIRQSAIGTACRRPAGFAFGRPGWQHTAGVILVAIPAISMTTEPKRAHDRQQRRHGGLCQPCQRESLGTVAGGSGNVIGTNANDATIGGRAAGKYNRYQRVGRRHRRWTWQLDPARHEQFRRQSGEYVLFDHQRRLWQYNSNQCPWGHHQQG